MAVYTEVPDHALAAFVAEYALGRVLACKGIADGVENTNYLLVTETGTYVLTLFEKRVREADLPFFLGLMEHLAGRGVPCPVPVRGRDGRALRTLAERPAAICTFLPGLWPKNPSAAHCAAVGEAMAAMHLAATDFPMQRVNELSISSWRRLLEGCVRSGGAAVPGFAGDLAGELEAELDRLEKAWPDDLAGGIIHGDLFPDNVFFTGQRLSGIIDFYFSCTDYLAYDLAICLNAWCFEQDGSFNITKARRMLNGYRARRVLTKEELEALPLLARGAAMRFLLTRLHDWLNTPKDALVSPKNPAEYVRKLRFHRGVRGPAGYGLE